MGKLTILVKVVDEDSKVVTIDNNLEELQNLVGGYIEVVPITADIVMIVNEEGKINNLPENFSMYSVETYNDFYNYVLLDTIHGNVFFASVLGENLSSLDKMQMQEVRNMFKGTTRLYLFKGVN